MKHIVEAVNDECESQNDCEFGGERIAARDELHIRLGKVQSRDPGCLGYEHRMRVRMTPSGFYIFSGGMSQVGKPSFNIPSFFLPSISHLRSFEDMLANFNKGDNFSRRDFRGVRRVRMSYA